MNKKKYILKKKKNKNKMAILSNSKLNFFVLNVKFIFKIE